MTQIKSPQDVKKLNMHEITVLCSEIRNCLLKTVSENGGHLASNLGVVELTVALHAVFDAPIDKIVFDVGHQCYTHKLLTGRFEAFGTLRLENGISGYTRPAESVYDHVVSGHSSTAISSAFGIAKGDYLSGVNSKVVAVVGDGAFTGGMAYEALNNAGMDKSNLIVILNDNKMSISKNVGALARQLGLIRTKKSYFRFKHLVETAALNIPVIGKKIRTSLLRSKTMLKNAIYNSNIFEGLGFNYMGPIDGHDIERIKTILEIAKTQKRPSLIHVITIKGKGYQFAESNPGGFHGVSAFDIKTGSNISTVQTFSSVFGEELCRIAKNDEKVCAISAAMISGTGLADFSHEYKNRFFDVGIAEQHAVTFSAGLATSGMKPVFAVYSSFLQRGYDQLIHDAAIASLPITVCIDRAGFVGEDGETHQGLFDISFLSSIPSVVVYSPACFDDLRLTLQSILKNPKCVNCIRYPRGGESVMPDGYRATMEDYSLFYEGNDAVIVTYGLLFSQAVIAATALQEKGVNITVLKLNKVHPIEAAVAIELSEYKNVFIFEEAVRNGSVGEKIATKLLENGFKGNFHHIAVDGFVPAATVVSQRCKYGLDAQSMITKICEEIQIG